MSELVQVRQSDSILFVNLNDPERSNPLSLELVEELHSVLQGAAEDDGVRAVILSGAGRHFSAGADLAALEKLADDGDAESNRADSQRLERLFAELIGHPKLTVAAVRGAAVAGGCGLATACDFVVADRSARFAYTELKIGFVPALVSTFLSRRVPGHVVRRLLLDPEMIDAARAAEIGLVDDLVEEGRALTAATELAISILQKTSPAALAATKELLNRTVGKDWREALAVAAEVNAEQRLHPECRRGVRSFLDSKTTPDWLESE
jgi:methylglutaconyl-CoA hydratase